jgi:gas vesicle protein
MSMQDQQTGRRLDHEQHEFAEPGTDCQPQSATSLKEKAQQAKSRVAEQGAEAINRAKDKGRAFADDQKNHLGERIHGYGSAVRRAADKLREERDPNIAHYAEMVADRLDEAADYVRTSDPSKVLRDVENAARRRPEIFFGGMFVAGLVLARFLKASSERDDSYMAEPENDYWVEDSGYEEESAEVAPMGQYPAAMPAAPASEWSDSAQGQRPEAGRI